MNINQITNLNTNELFEYITSLPPGEGVDALGKINLFLKNLKETFDEAKKYLASSEKVEGKSYELVTTITSGQTSRYDPQRVFKTLEANGFAVQQEFLKLMEVSKSDFKEFCKNQGLKLKDHEVNLKFVNGEPVQKISIKAIKLF